MTQLPLDDYHFQLETLDEQVRHKFSSVLEDGDSLLWVGKMKRGWSYWLGKGFWALLGLSISLFLTFVLWFLAYIGFYEGEQAGKYPRVFMAFGASLIPWIASYLLVFRRIIYDSKTRYALTKEYVLLYLPFDRQQPYQGRRLEELQNLGFNEHSDNTTSITYSIEVPNDKTGETYWIDIPLFDFLEDGLAVFNQMTQLQQAALEHGDMHSDIPNE